MIYEVTTLIKTKLPPCLDDMIYEMKKKAMHHSFSRNSAYDNFKSCKPVCHSSSSVHMAFLYPFPLKHIRLPICFSTLKLVKATGNNGTENAEGQERSHFLVSFKKKKREKKRNRKLPGAN